MLNMQGVFRVPRLTALVNIRKRFHFGIVGAKKTFTVNIYFSCEFFETKFDHLKALFRHNSTFVSLPSDKCDAIDFFVVSNENSP